MEISADAPLLKLNSSATARVSRKSASDVHGGEPQLPSGQCCIAGGMRLLIDRGVENSRARLSPALIQLFKNDA